MAEALKKKKKNDQLSTMEAPAVILVVVCGVGQRGLMLRYAGQDAFLL